ncbi:MAG: ATP-binding protein [Anaerolineae bacterium]|jgi:signal transduction histidine kinase
MEADRATLSVVQQASSTATGGEAESQRLGAIFEIAKILATQQDLDDMLTQFLACLVETLESVDAGVLMLYDPDEGRMTLRAARGFDLEAAQRVSLAPGEAMCGKVYQSAEVQLYPTPEAVVAARQDMTPANRQALEVSLRERTPAASAICLPLFTGETKIGALMLENRHQPNGFVPHDLPFLQALADLIALSVENARLRSELQLTRSLEEANRLKAELLSTLAHEMRTPLTSIKGYSTALLMDEVTFDSETQQGFLEIIDEECDVLQDLIHDLLESSIIDAGLLRLEPQPVRIPRLVQGVIDDITHRTDGYRFLVDFPDDFPIVDADPQRISQVMRNLLDNAVKYSRGGLVVVRGEVNEGEVVVSVADQGVGIAPEHLNRLFEKFFRIESGLGRHVVGSGLGLPICHTIVESHGGRIWAESKLGEGSTFFFTLPLQGISQESAQQGEER